MGSEGSKERNEEEKLGIREGETPEGQLLKTQEELVVTQNQCAVTAGAPAPIENYAQLQSARGPMRGMRGRSKRSWIPRDPRTRTRGSK